MERQLLLVLLMGVLMSVGVSAGDMTIAPISESPLASTSMVVSGKDLTFQDTTNTMLIETKAFTKTDPDVTTLVTPVAIYDQKGSYKFTVGLDFFQVPETVQFVLTSQQPLEATEKGVRYVRSVRQDSMMTTTEYVEYDFTDVANMYTYPVEYVDENNNTYVVQTPLPYKVLLQRNGAIIEYDFTKLPYSPLKLNLDPTISINNVANYSSINNNVTTEALPASHITVNDSSIIGYWNADYNWSTTGEIMYDYSMYHNDATGVGTETKMRYNETGYIGGAVTFYLPANNGSEYFDAGNGSSTNSPASTQKLTICAWYNARNTNISTGHIVGKENSTTSNTCLPYRWRYQQAFNNFNFLTCDGTTATGVTTTTNNLLNQNQWTHVCLVYNLVNATFYKNGTFNQALALTRPMANSTGKLAIFGAISNSANNFNGSIDELIIYNRSLTAGEVNTLYQNQLARFAGPPATQQFQNISIGQDGSMNGINITTNTTLLNNSNLSLILMEYNALGVNTANSSQRFISHGNNVVTNFSIATSTYNVSLLFLYNTSVGNNFYTSVLRDTIVLTSFSSGGGGGSHCVVLSVSTKDYWPCGCDINTTKISTGSTDFIINGTGETKINSSINGYALVQSVGLSTSALCIVKQYGGVI